MKVGTLLMRNISIYMNSTVGFRTEFTYKLERGKGDILKVHVLLGRCFPRKNIDHMLQEPAII